MQIIKTGSNVRVTLLEPSSGAMSGCVEKFYYEGVDMHEVSVLKEAERQVLRGCKIPRIMHYDDHRLIMEFVGSRTWDYTTMIDELTPQRESAIVDALMDIKRMDMAQVEAAWADGIYYRWLPAAALRDAMTRTRRVFNQRIALTIGFHLLRGAADMVQLKTGWVAVHTDVSPFNMFFSEETDELCLVDLGSVQRGLLFSDILYFCTGAPIEFSQWHVWDRMLREYGKEAARRGFYEVRDRDRWRVILRAYLLFYFVKRSTFYLDHYPHVGRHELYIRSVRTLLDRPSYDAWFERIWNPDVH